MGEGPPPLPLRKFLLAAGVNSEVHGLGARAIYGDRILTWREFEEAWTIQQALMRVQQDDGNLRTTHTVRRALVLEKQGLLEDQEAARPDWIPLDPGL